MTLSKLLICGMLFACTAACVDEKKQEQYEVVVGEIKIDDSLEELQEALDSCLQDIRNNCKGVTDYALTLEAENARLNKLVRELKDNESGRPCEMQ